MPSTVIKCPAGFFQDDPTSADTLGNVLGSLDGAIGFAEAAAASATAAAASASAAARWALTNATANVLDFGADPTGVADSAAAIINALGSTSPTGAPQCVYLPAGSYRITQPFVVSAGQTLMGAGRGMTYLQVNTDFDPSATYIIGIAGASVDEGPMISDLTISFAQPADAVTTATAPSTAGSSTITVASTANILIGSSVIESTAGSANYPPALIPRFTTVTGIASGVVTLSTPLIGTVSPGQSINFGPSRTTFAPLGTGTVGVGGTGVQYPWAIRSITSTGSPARPVLRHVRIQGAWNGIRANVADSAQSATPWLVDTLEMGALNVGLDWAGWKDFGHLSAFHYWPFGLNIGNLYHNVYADYNNYALKLGEVDGLDARGISVFNAAVSIDDPAHYSLWTNLMLDGDASRLIVNNALYVQISNCYSSKSTISEQSGFAITGAANVTITNLEMAINAGQGLDSISVSNASAVVQIIGGYFTIVPSTSRAAHVTAGKLLLNGIRCVAPTGASAPFFHQSTPGQLQVVGCSFQSGTGPGVTFDSDNAGNILAATQMHGYSVSLPSQPTLGSYGKFAYQPFSSGGNVVLTGTTIADALPLVGEITLINAASASGSGAILPPAFVGAVIRANNNSPNSIQLYASGSDTVDTIAGSTGITVATLKCVTAYCYQAGQWRTTQFTNSP